jgi:hypothetical protein
MKTKRLLFISCLAAGAVIASPSFGKPAKKSAGMSQSKATRVAPHTTQVMRHNQNISPRMGGTRYYGGTRYTGTRYYGNYYGGGNGYYYGGSAYPSYSYYSGSPYSNWGYGTSSGYYPYSYYGGGYPYSGYNNYYSYYTPTYGYNASMVAAVQQRLGRLGYYHGVADGVIGPQTRSAIAAFESRNGMSVDGSISRPLLDELGLSS